MTIDEMFEDAKNFMVHGNKILQSLINTDKKLRNTHFLQDEELKEITKISVMNSFLITTVKMTPEAERKKLKCYIDYENSSKYLLLLKIK